MLLLSIWIWNELRNDATYGKSLVFRSIANVLSFVTNSILIFVSTVRGCQNKNVVTGVAGNTRIRRYFQHSCEETATYKLSYCRCVRCEKETFTTSSLSVYAGRVHNEKHKATVWCRSVSPSVRPSVCLSVPFSNNLCSCDQLAAPPAYVLALLSETRRTFIVQISRQI